jgi:hypothetical protein
MFLQLGMLFLLILTEMLARFLLRILHLSHMKPSFCVINGLLGLHITLVADYYKTHLRVAVHFSFLKPPGHIAKGLSACDIVDEYGSGC